MAEFSSHPDEKFPITKKRPTAHAESTPSPQHLHAISSAQAQHSKEGGSRQLPALHLHPRRPHSLCRRPASCAHCDPVVAYLWPHNKLPQDPVASNSDTHLSPHTTSKAQNLDRMQRGQRSQPEAGVGTSCGPSTPTWPWAALAGSGSEGSCERSTLTTPVFSVWREHGGSQPPRGLGGTSGVRVQASPWMGRKPLLPSNRDPIPKEATVRLSAAYTGSLQSGGEFPPHKRRSSGNCPTGPTP